MQVFEADWAALEQERQGKAQGEEEPPRSATGMWTISPLPGAFDDELVPRRRMSCPPGRSMIPPHHIEPCAGIATHTRFTFAATPKPGTAA